MAYSIFLVDDHKIFRDGLRSLLERREEFQVVGETGSGEEAVQFCKKNRPDVVLMDIGLPVLNGIEATAEITRHCPETKVIMLSMYSDDASVVGAIRAGARAFVLKSGTSEDLLDALRAVAKGGFYLCPAVASRVQTRIQRGDLEPRPGTSVLDALSPREVQVLRLVAEGKTSKEIAAILELGLQTVRSYRKSLMKKVGANNIAGLTQLALAAGLTRLPSSGPETPGDREGN